MPRAKVFISYSRKEKQILDELLPMLRAVPCIDKVLWYDEGQIDIGDKFHPKIQQALPESKVGILLLSNHSFTSDYILGHELPYLIEHADRGELKLGCLYLTAISDRAFEREIEVDGRKRTINLKEYVGAHAPDRPLDTLDPGKKAQIYKDLADWVAGVLDVPDDKPAGQRYELGIRLQARRDYWEHTFFLPPDKLLQRPELDSPDPQDLFRDPSRVDGEDLFRLLFGSNPHKSGNILGAAFGVTPPADPARDSLRVRLMTDDERLWSLPWGKIAYQGRRLAENGWTVELHDAGGPGMPQYPPHVCYFPGKVVLIGARDYIQTRQGAAHLLDVEHFFQSRWQKAMEPLRVSTTKELEDMLSTGSTRLLYYYGGASSEGLRLDGAEKCLAWSKLADLLKKAQSISAVFLNLLGEDSFEAMAQGRCLLPGAPVVLMQCHERSDEDRASRIAIDWLQHVLAANVKLDPVVALHRHPRGQVVAWTRYGSWQTTPLPRFDIPELVERLLNRHQQRYYLAGAKEDFYLYTERRIHHAVALGATGARVTGFPFMVSQHLRDNKREQEIFRHHSFAITTRLDTIERVDECVRRELGLKPHESVSGALLQQDTLSGNGFWFLVLGWVLSQRLDDNEVEAAKKPLRAIAEWCRIRLLPELMNRQQDANIRVMSVAAIETKSLAGVNTLEDVVADMIVEMNDTELFHIGELGRLTGVQLSDLTNYFRNRQVCSCYDRYRDKFPRLLLGERREMPFDEAVDTIRRGYPDNWGNLFEELTTMTESKEWPPEKYQSTFWESRDGR